jgi:tetratricopeptide (TPR) repeat protein
MKNIKLEIYHGHEWRFCYPEEIKIYEKDLDEAIEMLYSQPEKAKSILSDLIRLFPYYIDAVYHLALLCDFESSFVLSHSYYQKAVSIGLKCFPNRKDFIFGKDFILWGYLENRPFLRAYHGLSLSYWRKGEIEKAIFMWEKLLKLNPNDNQGIRDLYAIGCIEMQRYEELINMKKKYKECVDLDFNFSLALIYFIYGNLKKSKYYLDSVFKFHKNEIESIITGNLKEPEIIGDIIDGSIIPNKEYSKYLFKKWHFKYWANTKGALKFLEKYILESNF